MFDNIAVAATVRIAAQTVPEHRSRQSTAPDSLAVGSVCSQSCATQSVSNISGSNNLTLCWCQTTLAFLSGCVRFTSQVNVSDAVGADEPVTPQPDRLCVSIARSNTYDSVLTVWRCGTDGSRLRLLQAIAVVTRLNAALGKRLTNHQ
jgi:hypothetical protein